MVGGMKTVGIIGGGVAGLAAGIRLAKCGIRVRLFEARPNVGGCCSVATIDGFTFNNGALYLAMPAILDHAFAQLGMDRTEMLPLVKITAPQTTYLPDGTCVVFGEGLDVYVLRPDGQRIQVDVSQLIKRWNPVLQIFAGQLAVAPFSLFRFLTKAWRYLPRLKGTVADELERLFPDDAVRSAMAGMLLYTGLPATKTPAVQLIGLVSLLLDGLFIPAKGMGQLSDCLASEFTAAGGELNLGRGVKRIQTRGARVAALEMEDGEMVRFDTVISTVSGMHTTRLLGESAPHRMQRKVAQSPLSHRAVAVQLGLNNSIEVPSHSISILPWFGGQQQFFGPASSGLHYFNYTVPTVTLPDLAPAGGSVIEMFPTIPQDIPVEAWGEKEVDEILDTAIAALERLHSLDIAVKRIIGPVQYRDDLRLYEGAVYGLSPGADFTALFAAITEIQGLFQAGQTAYPGYGIGSSIMSGLFAADALLQRGGG
jgi:phytoene desaturase